jgi:hypothetical protein
MQSPSSGIEDDANIRAALEWFQQVAEDHSDLLQRMRVAQEYLRSRFGSMGLIWPQPEDLVVESDVIASYLAQAHSLLHDNRSYDATLGSRAIPWIKSVGVGVQALRQMPGVIDRVRRLLDARQQHPEGGLYELVAAARYAHEGFDVEFIPESSIRTADIRVGPPRETKALHIECKRLRSSNYESREAARVRTLFSRLATLAEERRLSVWVDVTFTQELETVPEGYLADRALNSIGSPLVLPDGYPWHDEFAEGIVRRLSLDAVADDTRKNGPVLVGPKLWRLLTGRTLQPGTYHLALRARAAPEDARYVDRLQMTTALSWQCLAPESIDARARHVFSLLADVDQQVIGAPMAMAHIGMYAERDTAAADRRRERNHAAVRRFEAKSKLLQINLHYYLPRIAEASSWTIDESVDWFGQFESPFLDDPKLLYLGKSDIDSDKAAWHLPPPPVPRGDGGRF